MTSSPPPPLPTRRAALVVLVGVALPLGCETTGDDDSAEDPTPQGPPPLPLGPTLAGVVGQFPVGMLVPVDGQRFAVGHDDGGWWAVSLACTHLACAIDDGGNIDWSGIRCPCHGSRYDRDGRVVEGPAVRNLKNHPLQVDGDSLIVDTSSAVEPGTRTAN